MDMLSRFWPARAQAKKPEGPISDLDAIIAEPVTFRFKGKLHRLEPVTLEDFLRFTNAQAELMRIMSDGDAKISAYDLAVKMHRVFSSVCPTLTLEDVNAMEQVQVAALYQLVLDMVSGQVDMGEGKKKKSENPALRYRAGLILAECSRAFGWSTETTLRTPARRLFALLKCHRELETKHYAEKMYDLIGVACTSGGDQKYIDALREMWRQIKDDAVEEFKPERVRYENGTPRIPWRQATDLMLKQMTVMRGLSRGR